MRFQDFSLPEFWKNASLAWLLAFILPVLLLNRAPWSVRRVFLTGIAAFAGMVLETVLLLHYQTKNGVLYQNIGILLTGFMAGLALGALVVAKMNWLLSKWMGIALLSGFFLLSATIGRRFGSALGMGLVETSLWLVLSGFFVAGVFAYASLRFPGDQEKVVAPLYASDLIGGCLGSILASLILAPIAGLSMSAYLVAPIAILSILLL